jgi:hypothetical protein
MRMRLATFLLGIALLLTGQLSNAAAQNQTVPPIRFQPAIQTATLPTPPDGFVWQRIEAIEVAVLTPPAWKRIKKKGPFRKSTPFPNQPLNEKGYFETGLTVKLLWHPQLSPGNEAKAVQALLVGIVEGIENNKDNKVIRSSLEEKSGKKMVIVRFRNAPLELPPIVVHTVSIGDPNTGLVYQFIFEGPESQWEEQWKIGEKILSRLLVVYQNG